MPQLFIHTTNSTFSSRDAGADYDSVDAAMAFGVQGAIAIASDEVNGGKSGAAVEVAVEREDGSVVLRSTVAVSVHPLLTLDPFTPGTTRPNAG
ncbi:DUF6894 family protein [Sphingomonas sp.]|uniref:DUF6894 family protein n=1 Tax=Sphingomonas sp. TaxID=28214 RepID=UPI003B00CE95